MTKYLGKCIEKAKETFEKQFQIYNNKKNKTFGTIHKG